MLVIWNRNLNKIRTEHNRIHHLRAKPGVPLCYFYSPDKQLINYQYLKVRRTLEYWGLSICVFWKGELYLCECVFIYLFEDIQEGKKQSLPKMSRTFARELLGKANSLRAMETAWGCSALEAEKPSLGDCNRPGPRWPQRNVLLGNRQGVGAPSPPPPRPRRALAGRVPSASGPHILGCSPAPIWGTLTLNLHLPTGSPRLLGAVW